MADPTYDLGLSDPQKPRPTAEYIHSAFGQKNLVAVELLGSVNRPGVYYVPENTELLKLLTLAGGVSKGADTDNLLIRKKQPQQWGGFKASFIKNRGDSYGVDLEELMQSSSARSLQLESGDFVFVPEDEPMVSDDLFRTASVLSLVVGSILTAVLIADRAREDR